VTQTTLPDLDGSGARRFQAVSPTFHHPRYRLIRKIGHGSVGEVHLAEDARRCRQVAVKVLPPFGSTPAVTPEQFESELRVHRQIRHPNVVEVLDHGTTASDIPYIVLERLHGRSLGACLRQRGALTVQGALRIAREAARGLSAVHESGAVHQDVKPDNLFLCDERRHGVSVKVLDFGFATMAERGRDAKVCGTLEYIAPEQVLAEAVDRRADIYGLGVVIFRMLTGELPFDACERRGILTHQLFSRIPPPSWLRDDLSADLDCLVSNAVRKHPDNRYGDMRELMSDLERALAGERVAPLPLMVRPDRFAPSTELGRRAFSVLAAE
jgi:eukaryotic-like serine/threonine-protein kinase